LLADPNERPSAETEEGKRDSDQGQMSQQL